MVNDSDRIDELTREIDRLHNTHPHLQTVLDAFGPLLVAKKKWLAQTDVKQPPPAIDPLRFGQGIALNQQHPLFLAEDPWTSAGETVAKAIVQGFPDLGEDMATLLRQISQGNDQGLCRLLLNEDQKIDALLDEKAQEMGISSTSLRFYLRLVSRFLLTQKAREIKPLLVAHAWKKGYCPVCGSFPHLAILGENGRRRLQCADCGHAWSFPRMVCPYCDHEDPENTNMFFIDGQNQESAFLCEQCRRYLLTVNRPSELGHTHADLIAITLLHLDIILQEKGYSPMTETDWNSIYPAET